MLFVFIASSVAAALVVLYGFGGGLYYHFYVRRRTQSAEWKCQPNRWLEPSLHRRAVRLGTFNLSLTAALSGLLAFHISRGGYTTMYFDVHRHGVGYLLFSTALAFLLIEALMYYAHRLLHGKRLYALIHRHHHRYTVTTPFVAGAMHPLELLLYQLIFALPLFLFPVHCVSYIGVILFLYLQALWQHSGVKLPALFPAPETQFHDDHHRYIVCNFGQCSHLFDWLHGTFRRSAPAAQAAQIESQ